MTDAVQHAINSSDGSHAGDICAACDHARKLERSIAAHKANWTRKRCKLERALGELSNRAELAFAACRSIRFATENAVRHGGDYSLNDLLTADKLAREALPPTTARKGGAR